MMKTMTKTVMLRMNEELCGRTMNRDMNLPLMFPDVDEEEYDEDAAPGDEEEEEGEDDEEEEEDLSGEVGPD